jgi:hypothetical protein
MGCDNTDRNDACLLDRHKDPLASVTTVLGRLVQYSQAKCIVGNSGRGRVWEWTGERATFSDQSYRVL